MSSWTCLLVLILWWILPVYKPENKSSGITIPTYLEVYLCLCMIIKRNVYMSGFHCRLSRHFIDVVYIRKNAGRRENYDWWMLSFSSFNSGWCVPIYFRYVTMLLFFSTHYHVDIKKLIGKYPFVKVIMF